VASCEPKKTRDSSGQVAVNLTNLTPRHRQKPGRRNKISYIANARSGLGIWGTRLTLSKSQPIDAKPRGDGQVGK
jgi:hypothetical protein